MGFLHWCLNSDNFLCFWQTFCVHDSRDLHFADFALQYHSWLHIGPVSSEDAGWSHEEIPKNLHFCGLCTSVPFVASHRSGVLRGCWLESRRNSEELFSIASAIWMRFFVNRGFYR